MSRIRFGFAGFAFALALIGGTKPSPAVAGPHPLFDDGGTLEWFTSISAAQTAAEAQCKLIFIDSGRLHCPNCRALISQVLPSSAVRSRIGAIAVGLADDADESDPRVQAIFDAGLPGAPVLPIVGFVTANLRWVTGWYGYAAEGEVCSHLSVAEQRLEFWKMKRQAARTPPVEPKPVVKPAPPAPPPAPIVVKPPTPRPAFPEKAAETPRVAAKPAAVPPPTPPPSLPAPLPKAAASTPPAIGSPTLDGGCSGGVCKAPARSAPEVKPPPAANPAPVRQLPPPVRAATPPPATAPIPTAPPAIAATTSRKALAAAEAAAAAGSWKEVLRASDSAAALPRDSDTAEIALLGQRALRWATESLQESADAAKIGRYAQAMATLGTVRREMQGRLQEIDAERGLRAVEQRVAIERGSPDDGVDPESARRKAYSEYRGTRWASLFLAARVASAAADAPATISSK